MIPHNNRPHKRIQGKDGVQAFGKWPRGHKKLIIFKIGMWYGFLGENESNKEKNIDGLLKWICMVERDMRSWELVILT